MKILNTMNVKRKHLPTLLIIVVVFYTIMYFVTKLNTL